MKIIKTNILQCLSAESASLQKDKYIQIDDTGKITAIKDDIAPPCDYLDYSDYLCLPGMIDGHVHLSQHYKRACYADNLLDWLNTYIFVEENKAIKASYARQTAQEFFRALKAAGTTCATVYTAIYKEACDIAFEEASKSGLRIQMGKTMMDMNCPDFLREDTATSLAEASALCEKWHRQTPLLEYVFTPRFAPVCSRTMMQEIGNLSVHYDTLIQTHLSENVDEIAWVAELYPECNSYTDVYKKYNLAAGRTIFGHAIHLSEAELNIIKDTDCRIAHCPDSNFFLKSGVFAYKDVINKGIKTCLATDVAAGTSYSLFNVMKMTNYHQEHVSLTPEEIFYQATCGSAAVINMGDKIGTIEAGKQADMIFLKYDSSEKTAGELIAEFVFMGSEKKIEMMLVAGKQV